MTAAPRLGVIFPQTEIGNDPSVIRDFAQAAEGLGYSHVLAFDHVLGVDPAVVQRRVVPPVDRGSRTAEHGDTRWNGPYTKDHAFHEPFVLFGFLTGATSQLEFATGVLILPQRQTALVAKQAAEVDILSGGRLRLGVGVGWNPVEYEALGQPFHSRGKREDEQIELLRRLWREETVEFAGNWDRVEHAGIKPRPDRDIPVWVGGNSRAAQERAARCADGWIPVGHPEDVAEGVQRVREEIARHGRSAEDFGIEGFVNYGTGGPQPERWARQLKRWRQLAPTHLSLNIMNAGIEGPSAQLQALANYARVAGDVLGGLSEAWHRRTALRPSRLQGRH